MVSTMYLRQRDVLGTSGCGRAGAGVGAGDQLSHSESWRGLRLNTQTERDASTRSGGSTLVARGLEKRYGGLEAVKGVDFEVFGGECFGFLGPNGAGKTT